MACLKDSHLAYLQDTVATVRQSLSRCHGGKKHKRLFQLTLGPEYRQASRLVLSPQ